MHSTYVVAQTLHSSTYGYNIKHTYITNSQCMCDWACENRAYPHIKIGMFFELQLAITFELI